MGVRRGVNRNLFPYVGRLLHTLVNICVDSISTSRDVAIQVFFNWMCKDAAYDDNVDNVD